MESLSKSNVFVEITFALFSHLWLRWIQFLVMLVRIYYLSDPIANDYYQVVRKWNEYGGNHQRDYTNN